MSVSRYLLFVDAVWRVGGLRRQDRGLACRSIFCYCQLGLSKVCSTVLLTLDLRPCLGDIQYNNTPSRVVLQCVAISFHAVWATFAHFFVPSCYSSWIDSVHYGCIKFYFKYLLFNCKILLFCPDYLSFSFWIEIFNGICVVVSTRNLISIQSAIQKYFEGYVLFFVPESFQWASGQHLHQHRDSCDPNGWELGLYSWKHLCSTDWFQTKRLLGKGLFSLGSKL